MTEQRLLNAIHDDPYNSVSAHRLPDGGIEIMLSHRITMDAAVLIRIQPGDNIRFFHDPTQTENVARTNLGGPWDEPGKLSDQEALDVINLLLSAPEWPGASGIEDVCQIVRSTGRIEVPNAPEWERH